MSQNLSKTHVLRHQTFKNLSKTNCFYLKSLVLLSKTNAFDCKTNISLVKIMIKLSWLVSLAGWLAWLACWLAQGSYRQAGWLPGSGHSSSSTRIPNLSTLSKTCHFLIKSLYKIAHFWTWRLQF